MFPVGMIVNNWAVKHNVAMFSELSFAVRWHGRLSRNQYYEYINVTFLTPAVTVDSLAEKLNDCPLNWCRYVYTSMGL